MSTNTVNVTTQTATEVVLDGAHCVPHVDVASALRTHLVEGLAGEEARRRLATYGLNELKERPGPSIWQMLLAQFNNFLIIILIVAAAISLALGEFIDASAILAIVVLNAVLGVVQESRAEKALEALKKMAAPNAQVIRDRQLCTIPARELVPGDVVLLESGNFVPADMRLVESVNLKIEEASLTGESVPVEKDAQIVLDREIPIGDRVNTAYMSTMVSYGRGKGIVVATGMRTEIGKIAEMIQSYEEEPTPLQRKLEELGKKLGIACLAICAIVFGVGVLRGEPILEMFLTAVSLAIAAVPEGLPAIVTIVLALGMQRMIRRHALLRKLPAVETLGCATTICSDKTGTLTQNEMMVVRLYTLGDTVEVSGEGYTPTGDFRRDNRKVDVENSPTLRALLVGGSLCNDASIESSGEVANGRQTWRIFGDPTEGALVVAAAKAGFWRKDLEVEAPRICEVPFDSERKRMTTVHRAGADVIAHVKGAPDVILELCDRILTPEGVRPITQQDREAILAANDSMASDALRVLGVAYRPLAVEPVQAKAEELERELIFVGLMGMIDPARPEVRDAITLCRQAGIRPVMITGDFRNTAVAIATQLGLLRRRAKVLTGSEMDQLDDEAFSKVVEEVDVYARVSPQHKVRIVEALKQRDHVVAMTGDGVNDAPALKRANIGVAMGIKGTDVTKETADMVLTDDNFASIVAAIDEGRIIYSNIRKFVFFLLSCNVGEILVVFVAMLANLPLPLRAIHLLWLNLLTDGFPALALGMEKGDPDNMRRPPRPVRESILNAEMQWGIGIQAIFICVATLGAFVVGLQRFGGDLESAQTVAFATLVTSELLRAFTSRSERYSLFSIGVFSNRYMVLADASSFVLLLAVMYVPFLQPVFYTIPLGLEEWLIMVPFILLPSFVAEATKLVLRRTIGRGPKPELEVGTA